MYSSLDRVDIVAKKNGAMLAVQTDHRSSDEIEAEPDLSVVFALVRALNPRRMQFPDNKEPQVLFQFAAWPPLFLRHAIVSAGAEYICEDSSATDDLPPAVSVEALLDKAFAGLAQSLAAQHGIQLDVAGVAALEEALTDAVPDVEEDEIAYWSTVVQLGGFAGEVIRARCGGRWVLSDQGTLPFALETTFRGDSAVVNPLGKAVKRLDQGPGESVAFLVQAISK